MQHRHREVLVNILKMYGGTTPRTISPHPSAPTPQDHILQQMLYQQQQQRIPSPMNNGEFYLISALIKIHDSRDFNYINEENVFSLFLYLFISFMYIVGNQFSRIFFNIIFLLFHLKI